MRSVRIVHRVHKWTGLISGLNVLLLSLTGSYLVFKEELNVLFTAQAPAPVLAVSTASATPVQDAFDALDRHLGGAMPMRVRHVEDAPHLWGLDVRAGKAVQRFTLDKETGEVRPFQVGRMQAVNEWVFKLHATLFLGKLGSFVLAAVALLFLISTGTGLYIYAPFMKQVAFGTLRLRQGLRRGAADLHKLVGISSLGFNLLMAVTGLALTAGLICVQLWSMATIQSRTAGAAAGNAALPPIDVVLAAAQRVHPDAPIDNVAFPGGYQGKGFYMAFHLTPGALARYIPTLSLVPVSAPEQAEALAMPWWVKAIMVCFPLHFGNFAGLGLKIVYSLFGVTAGLLAVSGVVLSFKGWRSRRRARARVGPAETAGVPAEVQA